MSAAVVMVLMGLGCSGLETEEVCDGLDDDRDGLIDEGLLGYEFELGVDEAGVSDVGQGAYLQLRFPVGMRQLGYEAVTSDATRTSYLGELDGEGRVTRVEYTTVDADGGETFVSQSAAYEGDLLVWDAGRKVVDGEDVLDYEQTWTYGEGDLPRAYTYTNALNGQSDDTEWVYDAQDREVLMRMESSVGSCTEWATVYDDTLNTKTTYHGVQCGDDPPDLWHERTTYDSQGRVLSIDDQGLIQSWTWQGEDPSTYTATSGSTRVFQTEDGVLVSATGEGELGDWLVDYNSSGRIQEVSFYSDGEVQVHNGFSASFSELAGEFLSGYTRTLDEEPVFSAAFEHDELGNLIGRSWENLASGVSGELDYSVVCEER